jgi:nucleotide-binding universal stress UspA family protein
MYRHILLPTDGSERSGRTVKAGLNLAKAVGAVVTGLYSVPRFHPLFYENVPIDREK